MPQVRLITGTARSERAAKMDAYLAEAPDRSLLIVPTEQHAQRRTEALLRLTRRGAFIDPPVTTFDGLVRRILRGTLLEHAGVEPLDQHLILRRVVRLPEVTKALRALGDAANTEGFLDHVLSVIAQLKQAAIEPGEFLARIESARRKYPMDRVVHAIYDAYQKELVRVGAVDLQGRYWLVRDECNKKKPDSLAHIETLLIDEFDDFTPSEFSVIVEASRHFGQLVFGLNFDTQPGQRDLFAVPLQTAERIRGAFADGIEQTDLPEPAPARVTEFLASTLLVRDEVARPKRIEPDLHLLECHTIDHEIETIARRIKPLVRDAGVAPSSIALVWRKLAGVEEAVAQVFAEFGIPLAGPTKTTVARSSLAGFLLQFIDAAQTWSASGVTDVLSSPWFVGPDALLADAFATLVRAARPRAARSSWERAVARLATVVADPHGDEMKRLVLHMPRAPEAGAALQAALTAFVARAGTFPASGTVAAYAEALDTLLDALPIQSAIDAMPDPAGREREPAALDAVRRGLYQLHTNDCVNGGERIALAEFASLLRRTFALLDTRAARSADGVVCLDMEAARYLAFDYVFLAGMTGGEVPARAPVNALYGEDERAELRALEVPLEDTQQHDRREMLLFQRMFSTARRQLTVSWHGVDRGGKATQRSLYIEEIAERLPGIEIERPNSPKDALVSAPQAVACDRDLRNLAFAGGTTKELSKRFPEIAAAARVESARQGASACGEFDGVLASNANLTRIAAEYGAECQFSATALETYASCPFRFFQDRVLRLFAIEPTKQTLDRRVEGSVLHGALERFHSAHVGKAVTDLSEEEAAVTMSDALDAAFSRATQAYAHLAKGLLAAEKAKLARILSQYLAIEREKNDGGWKPALFEVGFGRAREDGRDALPPFRLTLDDGEVLLTGRIDRIDEADGAVRLVDYKSSKVHAADITGGRAFQLALYALAAEAVIRPGAPCDSAIYLAVGREKGETTALTRSDKKPDWDERVALARRAVAECVEGIRAGRFHPAMTHDPCQGCADEKVCRFQRARMQRKAGQ